MEFGQQHRFSKEEARARIKKLTGHWSKEHGVSVAWTDEEAELSGKILGCKFEAHLVVTDSDVKATGTDPGFLLRGTVTKYLKGKLAHYLDPSAPLDALEG